MHNHGLKEGGFIEEEVERVLHLGFLCASRDPNSRPTITRVMTLFEGKNKLFESEVKDMDIYLIDKMKSKESRSIIPKISVQVLNF